MQLDNAPHDPTQHSQESTCTSPKSEEFQVSLRNLDSLLDNLLQSLAREVAQSCMPVTPSEEDTK